MTINRVSNLLGTRAVPTNLNSRDPPLRAVHTELRYGRALVSPRHCVERKCSSAKTGAALISTEFRSCSIRPPQMMSLISFHSIVKLGRGAVNVQHRWLQAQLPFVLVAVSATIVKSGLLTRSGQARNYLGCKVVCITSQLER